MRNFVLTTTFLLLAGCGGSSIGSGDFAGDTFEKAQANFEDPAVTAADSSSDATFGDLLNSVRIDTGSGPVRYDARLDTAAQVHANDMVARSYFDHISPEGDDVKDRMIAQGYNPSAWGENLAGRQQSEGAALETWQDSPRHNEMMTADTLEDFGLADAGSGNDRRWVLVMGTEKQ